MNVYGPVPSRRLGRSLGINNIPYKRCSYACIYCQIGKAIKMQSVREPFFNPKELIEQVKTVLSSIQDKKNYPDYLSIVPDGEPTLDSNLGVLIEQLKEFNIPVAVISNASLLSKKAVQEDLLKADYVSLKIDAVNQNVWKKINKPFHTFCLQDILNGMLAFKKHYKGKLVTESMFIEHVNDKINEITGIAHFLNILQPKIAYIGIPTRPPAFKNVKSSDEKTLNKVYQIFSKHIASIEYLTGYEGNAFASTGNAKNDLLSITAVHPMREEAVKELLRKTNTPFDLINQLINEKQITKVEYNGNNYFIRKFTK